MSMPMHKSRLGRGLASLIGEPASTAAAAAGKTGAGVQSPAGEHRLVPIEQIRSSRLNPRKEFDQAELAELAESIRQKGLVQPIIARPDPAMGGYEIVAGERRWRACQMAGLTTLPVIVRDLADRDVIELAIIENVQRADLNAIEEASGYRELIERFQYTQDQLADVIGKSRSHIANTLRLLKLPDSVQVLVARGGLTAGHARALVGREDAVELAGRIIDGGLNVRDVEALVQGGSGGGEAVGGPGGGGPGGGPANSNAARRVREKDPDTRAFEKELTDTLGLKVEIKRGSGESGLMTIKYGNFDQLEYIRLRLTGTQG